MSFISDDEYVLLMDMPNYDYEYPAWPMHREDVKLCYNAGIQTATQFVPWERIETEMGCYDFSLLEEGIERITSSRMKLILYTYQRAPACLPKEWLMQAKDGGTLPVLSLWNREAQEYEHAFIRMMCQRYASDKVLLVNSLQRDGETVTPAIAAFYDPTAVAAHKTWTGLDYPSEGSQQTYNWFRQSIIETLYDQQTVFLENQNFPEIWQGYHKMIQIKWSGCPFIDDIYQAYRAKWAQSVDINVVQFTYTPHGSSYYEIMQKDIGLWNLKMWGGAEYTEGILQSTQAGKAHGLRGLVCAPVHYFNKHTRVEPWMLKNIEQALAQWRAK